MARKSTGTLVPSKSGWCARVPSMVDGEKVKVWYQLGTQSKAAARIKLARIVAEVQAGKAPTPAEAERNESFAEAAQRVHESRKADGVKSCADEIQRLRDYAFPEFGKQDVTRIDTTAVNGCLDACKRAGRARQTVVHLHQDIGNVFTVLKREGAVKANPAADAELPKFAKQMVKQRSVLTDIELGHYLGWVHPDPRFRGAVLERQTMACIARMFGGLRTGDLHALSWENLDSAEGAFRFGWAARRKTAAPQLLEIPELLRPIIRDWWERAGRPVTGVLFPSRRGKRAGQQKTKGSHAHSFRRDLRRAFGLDTWDPVLSVWNPTPGRVATARERELFEPGDYTLPVDFHSWRRAFSQALAEADVSLQQAQALAGHASVSAHERYIQAATKMRRLPAAALPNWPADTARVQSAAGISRNWVGVRGFEPPTAGTQSRPSTRLRYTPKGRAL